MFVLLIILLSTNAASVDAGLKFYDEATCEAARTKIRAEWKVAEEAPKMICVRQL